MSEEHHINKLSTTLQQLIHILKYLHRNKQKPSKMFQGKNKFKLSQNLKLGVEGPSSQGTFFKVGGIFFLLLSLFLVRNIYVSLNNTPTSAKLTSSEQKVLGAFDKQSSDDSTPAKPTTYTVHKGDTLFNIAQAVEVNWVVIATLNDLKAPYNLKPGTVLKLQ
jgi:LysM repeat protein